jgi:hypothetical protein
MKKNIFFLFHIIKRMEKFRSLASQGATYAKVNPGYFLLTAAAATLCILTLVVHMSLYSKDVVVDQITDSKMKAKIMDARRASKGVGVTAVIMIAGFMLYYQRQKTGQANVTI